MRLKCLSPRVPLGAITAVSLPQSFNGQSTLASLLCVHYRMDGQDDAMAWTLRRPETWKNTIEGLIAR